MADAEKSVPPIVVSQYRSANSPITPNRSSYASEKGSLGNSPVSLSSSHDDDAEDRALTITPTITHASIINPTTKQVTRMTTRGTTFTSDPVYEVDFDVDAPDDPRNWSMFYKSLTIFTISAGTLVVVLYSTSYTATLGALQDEFGYGNETIGTLGVTFYLFGLAIGSLILAPLAETYGRKPIYTVGMLMFTILFVPAATAPNIETIIAVRFIAACFGSAMIANAPGTIADIVSDEYRATAFSVWSIGPMNGPVFGPLLGGFLTQYCGWRWANWVVMILSGVSCALLFILPETYGPTLLQRKAAKLRKETGDDKHWSRYDTKVGFVELMKINLSRPFVMAVKEPICIFWNIYISLIYGILYLCFVAYPVVFTEVRGWSVAMTGLSFVGIGIGTMITICCASPIRKLINAHKPDATGTVPPEAMMSVVCIAAVFVPVGELWFAWTCYPTSIHWAIPIAAGIPFGAGNAAVFIYAGNYLAYSYGIYAASAMAGNAVMRSFLGGTLPLAGPAMYRAMGPNWAGTLLGLLEVLIIPIPFLFYRYGHRIREKSAMIRELRENEERQERKKKRAQERLQAALAQGDDAAMVEARNELCRVRSRVDDDPEDKGQEDLSRCQGVGIKGERGWGREDV